MPVKGGVREFREVLKDGDEMAKIGEAFKSITGAPSLPIDLSVILDAEAQLQEDLLARKNHNLEELKQLIEDTKDIPLEKLIWSEQGCDIFDHLCLRMDINQAYAEALPQWKDVADLLEVDSLRTQWVQTCVRPKEGLTRAILEIYMKDGGTLGEVLEALYKLDCLQVLQEIQGKVLKYLEQKDKLVGMKTAQGSPAEKIDPRFFSILATLATAMGSGDPCAAIQKLSNGLCRAQTNLSKDALSQPISHDLIVQNSTIEVGNSDLPPLKMRTYDSDLHLKSSKAFDLKKKDGPEKVCRIMLLFAEDGLQYADQVYGMVQALEHKVTNYAT